MAKNPTTKTITRKQQSRLDRETKQRTVLFYGAIAVAVLVIGVLVYGLLDQLVFQQNRAVAKVESEKITVKEFQSRVRYSRYNMVQNLNQLEQYKQVFSFSADYFDQQIQQIVAQMNDANGLGELVLDDMIDQKVVEQQAAKMGISVSDAEVDKALQEAFGFYANGTPTPAPTVEPFATATLNAQQKALIPPTSTPEPTATLAKPAATATEIPPTPTVDPSIPTSTPFPTATPYTEEGYKQSYSEYLTKVQDEVEFTEAELRSGFRYQLLVEKIKEQVAADVATTEEQVWARHILVASVEEAKVIQEKLKNGEDFAKLAADFSTDPGSKDFGGDLGWFGRGMMVEEFENAAYALTEIGQISEPVQTQNGWHIIQLLGREERPLTADQLEQAKTVKYQEWLDARKAEMKIEKFDIWSSVVPTEPALPAGY